MPLDPNIRRVLVIGSGPIVIGQAAEFDYAGTQACRALKEDGLEIVLVNSNPATIMTDSATADAIYIEPLTVTVLKRIIEKERPDGLLPTLGGQVGLTLAMKLAKEGFLERNGVRLLGAKPETIDRAEDRRLFKETMMKIGQPVIPSKVVEDAEAAVAFAGEIGYPVIVRPAFTLGGTGGGMAQDEENLRKIARDGLRLSPITQILVEKSVAGWKEIEFEVMRDSAANVIAVCSMENFDPVGIHTGDSVVVAPALTLADREYQMLRTAALDIITELEIEGGCNCQFALDPCSFEYAVIEVNPRVSRSSALASKATGYPIAKVAARIAVGYTLDEIPNAVTGKTCACFEPTLDYVALKFPRWPFDKFASAPRGIGTQMKATGEVMSLAASFEAALMKAIRGAEIHQQTLFLSKLAGCPDEELLKSVGTATDERLFQIFEALRRGVTCQEIHEITMIDLWYLNKLRGLVDYEARLREHGLSDASYREGKRLGYPDAVIEKISGCAVERHIPASYKMVDTCAGEFAAVTPYFYASHDGDNEAADVIARGKGGGKGAIVVLGSGPIRIGQGIEFDYSSVHCVNVLKRLGYEVVMINNNPETVSTDFDTADRLYFEPLAPEDVRDILELERPVGVVVAYGGQTAIKLAGFLHKNGYEIIGTPFDSIDLAEDRERFDSMLGELGILRPSGGTVRSSEDAIRVAGSLGYPVLVRPSYVLGGQNMTIAFSDEDLSEYMGMILSEGIDAPVLIDKYLRGIEIEVDAVCDGRDILIPGIMEHVERTGIHSGDSIAVYPALNIDDGLIARIVDHTRRMALAMNMRGLINVQYIVQEGELYVIEVNPRASRTVPYISKVTGVPLVELATRAMLGERLAGMGYGTGLYGVVPYAAVKVPVFSFEKLLGVDAQLGPEMKSTGEVLGIGKTLEEAMYKGLVAAGYKLERGGGVLFTVRDDDKPEIVEVAKKYAALGFTVYATKGTAFALSRSGLEPIVIHKISEACDNVMTLIESGKARYVVSTSKRGRDPARESAQIRALATRLGIPCLTSTDTAMAVAESLKSRYSEDNIELVNINDMRTAKKTLRFCKMHSCGKDDLYFDCLGGAGQSISSPESLSIMLGDRHFGVGGHGVVMICGSERADAKMRLFNTDGSEGLMSASAVACVGKYLYEKGLVKDPGAITVETQSGVRRLELHTRYGVAVSGRVNLGVPNFDPSSIPVNLPGEKILGRVVDIGTEIFSITCVSMGSPHCVLFCDNLEKTPVETIGSLIERAPMFPNRSNVEFVQVLDENTLRMRIWERGDGETPASGSGACASVVAAVENGFCARRRPVRVIQNGGEMTVDYSGSEVILDCKVHKIFEGEVEI
ncbi:MAG: carbamoyl-phosphate synthase large subunit [Synergistaceae bacterium]|jgi:carbamoyl-phosphate synthase large subunit|nr:carbamoyl-phosphate synthase large subunit [Synergistaceae bacterium]